MYVTSHPETVTKLPASLYADNVVAGAKDEDKAYEIYLECKCVLKEERFSLRKFVINAASLQQKIDTREGSDDFPDDDQSFVGL